jgi:molybdopterin-containing oxidoreductase family iron-sulfur binding subunit
MPQALPLVVRGKELRMNTPEPVRKNRRALIAGGAAAALGVLLAPGIRLIEIAGANAEAAPAAPGTRAAGTAASTRVRWGMLIDATRCSDGCSECVKACNTENHLSGGTAPTDSQWIRKVALKDMRSGKTSSAPVMCQHCAEPPCVDVCPTGASMKRADGIVLVDRHSCIGCRYCMMACPYKARSFVHETITDQNPQVPRGKGCVESCTLCVHRVDAGKLPACVESCPTQAMLFGDLNDPESAISQRIRSIATTQIRADLRLDTGVRYHGI